jgi:hypothetical protein
MALDSQAREALTIVWHGESMWKWPTHVDKRGCLRLTIDTQRRAAPTGVGFAWAR